MYSENAKTKAVERIESIQASLETITTKMQKYDSQTQFHFAHVGDLGRIDELLTEVNEFMVVDSV